MMNFNIFKVGSIFLLCIVISTAFVLFSSKPTEESIKDTANIPQGTLIKIFKQERVLKLYVNGELTNSFRIGLGSSPIGDKNQEGDRRTPTGKYYICTRNDKSRFTLFLGINYPNIKDAARGLQNGLINQQTFEEIKYANERKLQPPWKTPLGGEVGIHGGGNSSDWTWGCIALSDDDIRTLWRYAQLKTPVEIYE